MQVETRGRQRRAEVALPTEGNNPARAQTLLGPPGTGENPPGHPHVNGASEFFKNGIGFKQFSVQFWFKLKMNNNKHRGQDPVSS